MKFWEWIHQRQSEMIPKPGEGLVFARIQQLKLIKVAFELLVAEVIIPDFRY